MSEKINLIDLSALLAEKASITKKDAEIFLREYFEIMNEELIKSGLLKIKDLGTFKLSMMEDRESINVTTGERVLIPAHYKVVFTPDKKLAETVNEPFTFFETTEIEESILDELQLLPEEETLEESEPGLEEEEFFDKRPIYEEEIEPVVEQEPLTEEEIEPVVEQESLIEEEIEPVINNDSSSIPDWTLKSRCLHCYELNAHRAYRKKYYQNRRKLNRLRIYNYILSFLLIAALGYIAHLLPLGKYIPFRQTLLVDETNEAELVLNSVPKTSVVLTDSIAPEEEPAKNIESKEKVLPKVSGESKQITTAAGQRLTTIALEEYGNKVFWIYIYIENKAILSNPNILPVGVKISLPPASRYGIDCNDSASIKKAKEIVSKYY
jgi:nucleoid DNA-binding protein